MKTLPILLTVAACLSVTTSFAQGINQESVSISQAKKGEDAQGVMETVKTDFPAPIVNEIAFLPKVLTGRTWNVNERNTLQSNTTINFYEVRAAGPEKKIMAVYDKTGKLLVAKETRTNITLPEPVQFAIDVAYPGWKITKDEEHFVLKNGKETISYRVDLRHEKLYRHVYLNDEGTITRVVKPLHI